ncbi:MAG: hypothetical protein ACK5AV_00385 [Alphaproteobacteria bacterium]|jgi:hypothetical protein|nr:hypothetical protein [Candidatus Jidaibacter sp.]
MQNSKHTLALKSLAIDLLKPHPEFLTYDRLGILISMNLDIFYKYIDLILITQDDTQFIDTLSTLATMFRSLNTASLKAIIIDFPNSTVLHLAFTDSQICVDIKRQTAKYTNYYAATLTDQLSPDYTFNNYHLIIHLKI